MMMPPTLKHGLLATLVAAAAALPPSRETLFSVSPGGHTVDPTGQTQSLRSVQTLKDISGMAYIADGTFVAVHDMKADEDSSWARVSLLQIPYDLTPGFRWAPLSNDMINWPTDRELYVDCLEECMAEGNAVPHTGPNDLESVAGIPGTNHVLLCESTNSHEDTPLADRIYLAEVHLNGDGEGGGVTILNYTNWHSFTESHNVEATAVAPIDGGYLFLWGERDHRTIHWTDLWLEGGLSIGQGGVKGQGSFTFPESMAWSNRPVVGLDVDAVSGEIYLVSSFDLEGDPTNPVPAGVDADNGPYQSATSTIGNVDRMSGEVTIYDSPRTITRQDGFKVETVARAQLISDKFKTAQPATFIGTDDENYGGTLRKIKM